MEVIQRLPLAGKDVRAQVVWVIALWLLLTFSVAFALTLFVP